MKNPLLDYSGSARIRRKPQSGSWYNRAVRSLVSPERRFYTRYDVEDEQGFRLFRTKEES